MSDVEHNSIFSKIENILLLKTKTKVETSNSLISSVTNQTSKIERIETQLREANENIRELQAEIETKSAALSHEKAENQASQSTIDKLKADFDTKLNEREESLKKMFMRNMVYFFSLFLS